MRNEAVANQPGPKGDPAFLNGCRLCVDVSSFAEWLIVPFQAVLIGHLRADLREIIPLSNHSVDIAIPWRSNGGVFQISVDLEPSIHRRIWVKYEIAVGIFFEFMTALPRRHSKSRSILVHRSVSRSVQFHLKVIPIRKPAKWCS